MNPTKIPEEIIELAQSLELYKVAESLGNKYALHIDQIGELDAEIRDILKGYSKATEFKENIKRRLEISEELADKITTEANVQIQALIKSVFHEITERNEKVVSSIEKAGNFSVEKKTDTNDNGGVKEEDKEKILSNLETPPWKKETVNQIELDENRKEKQAETKEADSNITFSNTRTEPAVDLITNKIIEKENEPIAESGIDTNKISSDAPKNVESEYSTAPNPNIIPIQKKAEDAPRIVPLKKFSSDHIPPMSPLRPPLHPEAPSHVVPPEKPSLTPDLPDNSTEKLNTNSVENNQNDTAEGNMKERIGHDPYKEPIE